MSDRNRMLLILVPVLAVNVYWGLSIHRLSLRREGLKQDYSQINSIRYGLLSVDSWKERIRPIFARRIADFNMSMGQERVLRGEISKGINALLTEADRLMRKPQTTLSGKMKKLAFRAFVNMDDIRKEVPAFTQAILNELQAPSSVRKFKKLAQSGLADYTAPTYDSPADTAHHGGLLARYQATSVAEFNRNAGEQLRSLDSAINSRAILMLDSALLFLFAWWLARKKPGVHRILFSLSAAFALVMLMVGLATPMIDIDARIKSVDFLLWGEHIQFKDQVLFFRSKTILQVVGILMETGKADSIVVGVLLLLFSVLFPISKLISMEAYMRGGDEVRRGKLVNFFAFRSGKWSMADVAVVAIFIAYIGFKGILNTEIDGLSLKAVYMEIIATNDTELQPGFILFTAFVLFGFALSEILKRTRGAVVRIG